MGILNYSLTRKTQRRGKLFLFVNSTAAESKLSQIEDQSVYSLFKYLQTPFSERIQLWIGTTSAPFPLEPLQPRNRRRCKRVPQKLRQQRQLWGRQVRC